MAFVAPPLNGKRYNEEGAAFKEQSEVCYWRYSIFG